jgi:hypothetical protein
MVLVLRCAFSQSSESWSTTRLHSIFHRQQGSVDVGILELLSAHFLYTIAFLSLSHAPPSAAG